MLSQCLSNPAILSVFGPDNDYQVVSGRIVRVEEVVDQAHQPKAAGENDELIFGSELLEQILLVLLGDGQFGVGGGWL
jgi:hypothetical protein